MAVKPEVRKGLSAIKEAAERKGGGDFKPFCPELRWSSGEEKNILVLTDLSELQEYAIHEWIKVGSHTNNDGEVKPDYDFFLSRKDPSIGEAYDEIESRLGSQPRLRFVGVGVELVPITEAGRGGKSTIVGWEVATDTYTAKDEDEEEVEVEYPCIGIISLSSSNFWGWLGNFQEKAEVTETVMSVTRQGGDKDTRYDFIPLTGQEVDLSAIVELAEGLSYIRETDDFDDVMGEAESAEDPADGAAIIADYLLSTRIAELSDGERYHAVVPTITELESRWGKGKGGKAKGGRSARKSEDKPSRATRSTARSSSRSKRSDAEPEAAADDATPAEVDAPETDSGAESDGFKSLRERARSRAARATQE
jgi:hypothetical protein